MSGPPEEVAVVRTAVRRALADFRIHTSLLVACSGGADSMALADAARAVHAPGKTRALVIDHGLQEGSASRATETAALLSDRGIPAEVRTVRCDGTGGPEAAARRARYAALRDARHHDDEPVLLGHTLDDQAETVLLGLGRGSGARSISGMARYDPPWLRPLLGVRRATTRAACAALGIPVWDDPHNADPRFTRVRLRTEALPLLEDILAGGVAEALARTAGQLAEDGAALDEWAAIVRERAQIDGDLEVKALAGHPAAVRRRVLRGWLLDNGVRELTDAQLRRTDELVGRWRGQGGIALVGGLVVDRRRERLVLRRPDAPAGDQ